jgi:hypothetical protein
MQPRFFFVSSCLRGCICAAFAVVVVLAQQPPQPTFRTGQTLIVQTVTVKDKDGKPIEGLTAKDFTITEDGEPQAITFVEFQRLPSSPVNGAQPGTAAQSAASASRETPAAPAPFVAAPGPAATVQQLMATVRLTSRPPSRGPLPPSWPPRRSSCRPPASARSTPRVAHSTWTTMA